MQAPYNRPGNQNLDQSPSTTMSEPESDKDKDDPARPSGRVRHDSGGRAVWEWAVDSGRHAIDSTSRLLKKLDLSGLQLEDDKKSSDKSLLEDGEIPSITETRADPQAGSKRGFNPYDSRTVARKKPVSGKPQPPPVARVTQPVRPPKPAGLFARMFGKDKK
jgi:hypothetical protein